MAAIAASALSPCIASPSGGTYCYGACKQALLPTELLWVHSIDSMSESVVEASQRCWVYAEVGTHDMGASQDKCRMAADCGCKQCTRWCSDCDPHAVLLECLLTSMGQL